MIFESYTVLFIVIFFGVLLSKVKVFNIGLGSSAYIFVALLFGHYGFVIPEVIESFGLILFIFSVGIQAGPGFFDSFRTGEARYYLAPVFILIFLALLFSYILGQLFDLSSHFVAGIFSGMMTSSPAFAAIVENTVSGDAIVGYTIAYPLSLIVTILSLRILPRFLKLDVLKEQQSYRSEINTRVPKIETQHFNVSNQNIDGLSIDKLKIQSMTGAIITRIQKSSAREALVVTKQTILNLGDLVKVVGNKSSLDKFSLLIGSQSRAQMNISSQEELITVVVSHIDVVGKRLASLNLNNVLGAEILHVTRSGISLVPSGDTKLRYGDKLKIMVNKDSKDALIRLIGDNLTINQSINFLPIVSSILLGILFGQIKINVFSMNLSPGISGGVLFMTLLLGRIGKTGPLLWSIAGNTNQFLRQLGLILFLCGVGTRTGVNFVNSFSASNKLLCLGVVVSTFFIIVLTSLYLVFVQRMNKLSLLGTLSGCLTCAASLPEESDINHSVIPLSAYSMTYPLAILLTIILGQFLKFLG